MAQVQPIKSPPSPSSSNFNIQLSLIMLEWMKIGFDESHISDIISANTLLERFEKPQDSWLFLCKTGRNAKQTEKKPCWDYHFSQKELEMQKSRLWENIRLLVSRQQAPWGRGRDLARLALERKNANLTQMQRPWQTDSRDEGRRAQYARSRKRMSIEGWSSRLKRK